LADLAVPAMTQAAWLKARPTLYKGIQMRSRLEALYAQSLDGEGTAWQYEPECFADEHGQYLPDFRADLGGPGDGRWWVEVKPQGADLDAALDKMHRILATEPEALLAVATNEGTYEHPRFDHWAVMCCPGIPCGRCSRLDPYRLHLSSDKPARELHGRSSDGETVISVEHSSILCAHCLSADLAASEMSQKADSWGASHSVVFTCRGCGWRNTITIEAGSATAHIQSSAVAPRPVQPYTEGDPF